MEDINDLLAFLAVARERNFTRAAAQLGVSQSSLSRRVRALEEAMNAPLLTRTTRSVSLTKVGEKLVSVVDPRLRELSADLDAVRAMSDAPRGTVRITMTDYAANTYVWPALKDVLASYPDIKIELVNDYGLADIVADSFDIGIRLGDQVERDMIATRIAPDLTMSIVGSPDYLQRHPAPSNPQELTAHNCINLRLPTLNSLLPWELKKGRRLVHVRVDGQLTFNNVYQMIEAALDGFGLAYAPKDLVEAHVESQRLSWVLEDWFPTFIGFHAYYPSRRKASKAIEIVINALRDAYRAGD